MMMEIPDQIQPPYTLKFVDYDGVSIMEFHGHYHCFLWYDIMYSLNILVRLHLTSI